LLLLWELLSITLRVFTSLPQNSYKIQINEREKIYIGSEYSEMGTESNRELNLKRDRSHVYE
jgi:hypothetical protein